MSEVDTKDSLAKGLASKAVAVTLAAALITPPRNCCS